MEGKKISFTFTKTKKVEKSVAEERKDFIDCLEGKSIKIVGGDTVEENKPLIIPMKPNTLITAERLKQIAEEVEKAVEDPEPSVKMEIEEVKPVTILPKENETIEQMAARELLEEAKKIKSVEVSSLTVPIPSQPVLHGQKESTLEDYDSVPVKEFGLAMLRGMGWTQSKSSKYKQPELRPKGLGLGADKVIKNKQSKDSAGTKEEQLSITKGGFVKIVSGKHSGCYGKVISLDEDSGRVTVDVTMKKETLSFNEFMLQAVTKNEFDTQSRVINSQKYEEYKNNETTKANQSQNSKSLRKSNSQPQSRRSSSERERSINGDKKPHNYESRRDEDSESRKRYDSDSDRRSYSKSGRDYERDSRKNLVSESNRSYRPDDKDSNKKYKTESRRDDSEFNRRHDRNDTVRSNPELNKNNDFKSGVNRSRYYSTSSEEEQRTTEKTENKVRLSSTDSLSSLSDSPKRSKKSKKKKDGKSSEKKRDIDKKRKGKKKKRDRDRSPSSRKHKK